MSLNLFRSDTRYENSMNFLRYISVLLLKKYMHFCWNYENNAVKVIEKSFHNRKNSYNQSLVSAAHSSRSFCLSLGARAA